MTITKLRHRYFLANFWHFGNFFWMVVFKVFSTCKAIFKIDIKSQILPELISLWCLYYNIWTRFYILLCLEESEVVARKNSIKEVFLNIQQNSLENICARVFFKSCTGAFLWIFWSQYLLCKTSAGVSFHKILSFYYKRKRELFYFEGTPS